MAQTKEKPATSDAARKYSREQGDKFKNELFEMLRIPSLSGDPAHAGDVKRMADWLVRHMQGLGMQKVAAMPTAGLAPVRTLRQIGRASCRERV